LEHHPHLHCVVPGGGLALAPAVPESGAGPTSAAVAQPLRWLLCLPNFFLPVKVLGRVFRGKYLAAGQPGSRPTPGPVPGAAGGAGRHRPCYSSTRPMPTQPVLGTVLAGWSAAARSDREPDLVAAYPGRADRRLPSGGAALSGVRRRRAGDPVASRTSDNPATRTALALGHLMSRTDPLTTVVQVNSPPARPGTDTVRTVLPSLRVSDPPCRRAIRTSRSLVTSCPATASSRARMVSACRAPLPPKMLAQPPVPAIQYPK
jgi:hypothetical protein